MMLMQHGLRAQATMYIYILAHGLCVNVNPWTLLDIAAMCGHLHLGEDCQLANTVYKILKVTGYSLLINIHEKVLPSLSPCRNQLQHAVEAAYNSTMSTF